MALVNRDRVMETSTTTGTGTLTLAGAVTGYQAFSAIGDGNTCYYSAWGVDANGTPTGEWEEGLGTYTLAGTTLARTTVTASSNGNAAVSFSAGTKRVANVLPASGTLVVRQPGGTAGTNELQIYADGTNGVVEAKQGGLVLKAPLATLGNLIFSSTDGGNPCLNATGGTLRIGSTINVAIGAGLNINVSTGLMKQDFPIAFGSTADVSLWKTAAGVIAVGSGAGSGVGWIQNSAGEAALASAFTKANATFGNTNLSLTVIAGRSYRIEGHLIVSNSTAGEGAQFDFNGGSATATTFDVALQPIGTNTPGTVVSSTLAGVLNFTSITGTNRILVSGYLKVNAGGTLILRAAENTTASGTMTLAAGSWLGLHDTVNL